MYVYQYIHFQPDPLSGWSYYSVKMINLFSLAIYRPPTYYGTKKWAVPISVK